MTSESTKSFAAIHGDYAFFETHATEAENDLAQYRSLLAPFARGQVRLLDFGCGPGGFSSRLLGALGLEPDNLLLTLVEPDAVYRQRAAETLATFTTHPIESHPALPEQARRFDIVVSNHVFYYVPAPQETLGRIVASLAEGGLFALTMAGRDNALIQFWLRAFECLGQPMPYNTAEDIAAALAGLGVSFETRRSDYDLAFPDSEENRMKILRFLLTEHLAGIPRAAALRWFDPYTKDGQVAIKTGHALFVVQRQSP